MVMLSWYLLKVVICSAILTAYYYLVLRNKVFHRWNRFYLLGSMVLSLVVPLLKINLAPTPSRDPGTVLRLLQGINASDAIVVEYSRHHGLQWTTANIVTGLYILTTLLFLTFFFHSLYRISLLRRKYPSVEMKGINFFSTDAKGTPFSFFRSIFWNRAIDLQTRQGQQIFNHEVTHVRENHSIDKLLINVILIFFWINPFFWIMKKEINMIHEFIADQNIARENGPEEFAALLLQTVFPAQNFHLTNRFFHSPLKRRILMFTKNTTPKAGYLTRLMVLPIATLLFMAFTFKLKTIPAVAPASQNTPVLYAETDTVPAFYQNKKIKQISTLGRKPEVRVTFEDGSEDTLSLEQAKKDGLLPPPPPPPAAPLPPPPPATPGPPPPPPAQPDISKAHPLIFIDGKESSNGVFKSVNPNAIEQIEVLKNEKATQLYGEKAKNGVVLITLKKNWSPSNKNQDIRSAPAPLYLLDGQETSGEVVKSISQNRIASVNVLKGSQATAKYGDKGKNGVVEVSLKPSVEDQTEEDPDKVFLKEENPPEFPGGTSSWIKFIQTRIMAKMDSFSNKDYGTCLVRFIVNTDGSVSQVEATTMRGTLLASTVVDAIKNGPKWIPATQNGHVVVAYKIQPVTLSNPEK